MKAKLDLSQHRFKAVFFDLGNTLMFFDGYWPDVYARSYLALTSELLRRGYALEEKVFMREFSDRINAYYQERDLDCVERTSEYVLRSLLVERGYDSAREDDLLPVLDAMYAVSEKHWFVENDAIACLSALQTAGFRLGLISNAAYARDVQVLIDKAEIRPYLEQIIISAEVGLRKPHKQIFHNALDAWNLQPGEAVMVGDSLSADIVGANQMGMASVWISRRVQNATELTIPVSGQPDARIDTLWQLVNLLVND
jgi:HAD superfamily hydrolase (TIGR01662 family)